ncbi:MAG: nicotinamide mononucleotide transporter family protein [Kibdelosporangium sp.]
MRFFLDHGVTILGQWTSYAEMIGQLCALAVVFLAKYRTLWTWPVQVAATVLLFSVYVSAHLGGLASRQVIILLISIYGWWAWTRRRDPVYGVVVRRGRPVELLVTAAVFIVGTVGVALLLDALDASWAPWPDAAIFVGTVVAFALQGRGLVEFWLVWLVVDAIGVPLQIDSGLWFSALIYTIFAGLVIWGYLSWRRTAKSVATAPGGVPAALVQPEGR